MPQVLDANPAFGHPGDDPRWAHSDKDGVGTASTGTSRVWYTLRHGHLTEVYHPTVDRPQVRGLQYLVSDGATFTHREEDLRHETEQLDPHALGFRVTCSDPAGRYRIVKEVLADPERSCVLLHTTVEAGTVPAEKLRLFVLVNPHLGVGGWGNTGNVVRTPSGNVLTAHRDNTWLAVAATVPLLGCSCGYVGQSDGWTDLRQDHRMGWQFDTAPDGNVALTGELELRHTQDFLLVLAFGRSLHNALVNVTQSRAIPFARHRERFVRDWGAAVGASWPAEEKVTGDGGSLYRVSRSLILAHEDKLYPGAIIASLSIPWGEAVADVRMAGGYHLVWTRDMCQAVTALLAAGDTRTPLRALTYLACAQRPDGGFYQNFWIDGTPYWHGVQLDETAYPVLLAHRLWRHGGLGAFDPYPLVRAAAKYLIEQGPVTPEDRWEENGGFSASTLAVVIAALVCAASFARDRDEAATAQYLLEYADFLVRHLESWCVTTDGSLVPGVRRHFIRLNPSSTSDVHPDRDPNRAVLPIRNLPPGARSEFPAKEVVSTGFLELVRFGVLRPDDPLVVDTLRVVDAVLKVETPLGPCWHRYNHDGYGQREDGGPFKRWGKGRAWPLLTGERGHYELAAGRDPGPYLRALEAFATPTRLLAEQVWDEADRPEVGMFLGKPTGGAMPLLWAHAEYIKLVRSAADGRVFDRVDEVADRYRAGPPRGPEVWKFNRQVQRVAAGRTLRVQASAPFRLHWTNDEWAHAQDTDSTGTEVGIEFVDVAVAAGQKAPLRFTFFWKEAGHWEGTNFSVGVAEE